MADMNVGTGIVNLRADTRGFGKDLQRAREDLDKTSKSSRDLNNSFRLMRGGAGQLGHQIQDMAVQAQMGTDALVIFGQQGSQVAAIFGPKGAMLGAVLAIGAAIAGPLFNAITGTSTVLSDLADEAKGASGAFNDLNRMQQEQRRIQVGLAAAPLLEELATQRENLIDANKREASSMRLVNLFLKNGKGIRADFALEVKHQRDRAAEASSAITDLKNALGDLFSTIDPNSGAKKILSDVNAQIENFGKTALQQQISALRASGADEAIISEIETRQMLLRQMQAEKQFKESLAASDQADADAETKRLRENFDKEEADRNRREEKAKADNERKRLAQIESDNKSLADLNTFILTKEELEVRSHQNRLDMVQGLLDRERITEQEAQALITGIIKKETDRRKAITEKAAEDKRKLEQKQKQEAISGVKDQLFSLDASNKKVFQMQKGYRMVEATMSAYQAANNALAAPFPFPIPQAMAAAALTLGLANVAQIKAQSFEGGGYTGMGSRSGGTDGRGGFLATLHPNESVIDHTKGQGAGITIINNVDARGSSADVDQKIKVAMQQTSQQTVLTIQDLMRRRRFA